jgi:Tol biopolymer transport system component
MFQSPDGRFLAFVTSRGNDIRFYIRDYANGRVTKSEHSYPADWTDDGQWLLFFESEKMILFSPDTDQEIDIPINISGCYSAVFTSEDR